MYKDVTDGNDGEADNVNGQNYRSVCPLWVVRCNKVFKQTNAVVTIEVQLGRCHSTEVICEHAPNESSHSGPSHSTSSGKRVVVAAHYLDVVLL